MLTHDGVFLMGSLLSVGEKSERNVAQIARRPLAFFNATNLRRLAYSVNCPELVQWPQMLRILLIIF